MTTTAAPRPLLHPFSLGELLDAAIRLYRRYFLTFLGVMALTLAPITLLELLLVTVIFPAPNYPLWSPDNPAAFVEAQDVYYSAVQLRMLGSLALQGLKYALIYCVGAAALARAAADGYLEGATGILPAYQRLGRGWLRMLGIGLLALLVTLLLSFWLLLPCIGWVSGAGMLLFFWAVTLPLALPVIVLEHRGIAASLRRAWELARQRFWWLLGFMFTINLLGQFIILGPATLLNAGLLAIFSSQLAGMSGDVLWSLLQAVMALVTGLLFTPLQICALTLVYLDLRVRSEGLDLAWQAAQTVDASLSISEWLPHAPAHEPGPLMTGRELLKFSALSLAGWGLTSCIFYPFMLLMFASIAGT